MRLIILTAFFVCALAANEETNSKQTSTAVTADKTENSNKLREEQDDIQSIPTSYQFKYSTGSEGPAQLFREEYRDHDGTVKGKYGYVDPHGKLRVINYNAGANGYSATGDIGPDIVAQNEAQSQHQSDPSVREQANAWSRVKSNKWAQNPNWNYQPVGWSSVDPLWNVGALPQAPHTQNNLVPPPPRPTAQTPIAPVDKERIWADRPQTDWQNSNANNWRKSQNRADDSAARGVDWNTWNQEQQAWTKQSGTPTRDGQSNVGAVGRREWQSNVQQQWQQAQTGGKGQDSYATQAPPSVRWAQQQPPQAPANNQYPQQAQPIQYPQQAQPNQYPQQAQPNQYPQQAQPNQYSPQAPQNVQWGQRQQPEAPTTGQWGNRQQPEGPPTGQWGNRQQPEAPPTGQWRGRQQPESPPSGQWSQPTPPSVQFDQQPLQAPDQWQPPTQGPTAGQWSQFPNSPTAGQWTQFRPNPADDQNSQTGPQNQPTGQWGEFGRQQDAGPQTTDDIARDDKQTGAQGLPEDKQNLDNLKQKWTGVPSGASQPPPQQWDDQQGGQTAPAGPSRNEQWAQPPQQPTDAQWTAPAPQSIADQWGQRQQSRDQWTQKGQTPTRAEQPARAQSPNAVSWKSSVQHDQGTQSIDQAPRWRSPARVARIGDVRQSSPITDQANINSNQQAQINQAQPNSVQPFAAQHDQADQVQPNPEQPNPVQPYPAQPNQVQLYPAQPDQDQTYPAQPNQVQPYPAQPIQVQPYPAQPNPSKFSPAQPNQAQYPPQSQPDTADTPDAGKWSGAQPRVPAFPNEPAVDWNQPAQPNQAQFPAQQPPVNFAPHWPQPVSADIFSGSPYVHFRIDHTVDPNQPPLRYQYSY